jgi:serine/threonine protein kinase
MIYPSNTDYLFAVQNPSSAFLSEDLKKCTVESRVNKQPLSWNGSFAIIYHLINCYEEFAVKCFTKNVEDIKKRYIALDKLFNNNVIDFLVKTEYKNKGIRVNKKDYEIIKMDWVKGKTLDRFILEKIDNNYVIKKLMDNFINVIKQMENLGIAHGDLQHGNILVTENCEIKLVDYDAMFIPEKYSSEHLRTKEIGHPNYQHPKRIDISSYDEKIDRFSAIFIIVIPNRINL